jgi:hypothetical protein
MTFWRSRISAAATLLFLSGAIALAQSEMKIKVPFTFHAAGATMSPGKYAITGVPGDVAQFYRLRDEKGRTTLLLAAHSVHRADDPGKAAVAFECAGEYCALKTIYPPFSAVGHRVPVKTRKEFRGAKTAEIRIPATQ